MLDIIKNLRKELHQYPELSGSEKQTANKIGEFIRLHHNTTIIENIDGYGLMAIYDFGEGGKTIGIRCELDALPIEEKNDFEHRSKIVGVSHKCGHDGHITMVAGLIFWLKEQTFSKGKVVLIFQPAEETGKGAFEMMNDPKMKDLKIDYLFALHNIPGQPLNSIIALPNHFSAEVISLAISLKGKKSHASEPENGINPALAIAQIIQEFAQLNIPNLEDEHFALLTPIHINLGTKSYGISAGNGELHYTIRTWQTATMELLKDKINAIVKAQSQTHQLQFSIDWFEHFPTTKNDPVCSQFINNAAKVNNFQLIPKGHPFKFGEDFGWFSKKYKVGMFGLGAGLNSPALHHEDYDFPEEILETGMGMFQELIELIVNDSEN